MRVDDGYLLRGTARFESESGFVQVHYSLTTDLLWNTTAASVAGTVGTRPASHCIRHADRKWFLDGRPVPALDHLIDLDFDFTPATNYVQLRRVGLSIGEVSNVPVAWFQLEKSSLGELSQRYERRTKRSYWYVASACSYKGLLDIAENGFVSRYPGLWQMVPAPSTVLSPNI
jgi:hypothetical protein